jgi:hypothetical protein
MIANRAAMLGTDPVGLSVQRPTSQRSSTTDREVAKSINLFGTAIGNDCFEQSRHRFSVTTFTAANAKIQLVPVCSGH